MVDGQTKWSVNWDADVWHNVAYEIDFSGNTVGFWHSTGGDPLTRVIAPVSASTSSNGADFHVGVLELPRSGYADAIEDIYFSGVYIETGSINTAIGSGSGTSPAPGTTTTAAPPVSTGPTSTTKQAPTTTAPAPTTTAAPGGVGQTKYGQCAGSGKRPTIQIPKLANMLTPSPTKATRDRRLARQGLAPS